MRKTAVSSPPFVILQSQWQFPKRNVSVSEPVNGRAETSDPPLMNACQKHNFSKGGG
nr:hypothetical protein [uncultured Ruminococcus sp.]